MRQVLLLIVVALAALAAGIVSAQLALDRGFGFQTTRAGPWVAWTRATAPDADPYTRAHFSRSGDLPPPPSESVVFTANRTTSGAPLFGGCTYEIEGPFPPARRWSLVVRQSDGTLIGSPGNRMGFTNTTVTRFHGRTTLITLSSRPKPNNWVPLAADGEHLVKLFLYDTPLATEALLQDIVLPSITERNCP